jgi:hypothetical protein
MADILRDHGFVQPVSSNENQIAGLVKEVQVQGLGGHLKTGHRDWPTT